MIFKTIGNFFLWLSGADARLIEESGLLSRTERTKYIGLGTTVVIPAMMSFFASSYAASTFIDTTYIYLLVGFVWSLIILSIDRLLVSTLYKSVLHGNIKFYAGLMARVLIAIVLGMVMSHPLTLFIFEDSIYAEAERQHEGEYQTLVTAYEKEQRDSLEYRLLLAEEEKLNIQYATITKERLLLTCLYELRTNEASGVVKESIYYEYIDGERVLQSCGTSTGFSGQRGRYADILAQAARVEQSIAEQDAKFQEDRATFDSNMSRFNENLASQTARIEKNTSIDYLARVNALSSLIRENQHVRNVYFILLLTLVLLDCLLVILKAVLPMGSYEMMKDKYHKQLGIDIEQDGLTKTAEIFTNKTNSLYKVLEQNLTLRNNILERVQEEEKKAGTIEDAEIREAFIAQIHQDAALCNDAIEHIQATMIEGFKTEKK